MKHDAIFEAALDFLENGSDLPGEKDMRAHDRFVFTAAIMRTSHGIACEANDRSLANTHRLDFWAKVFKGILAAIPIIGVLIGTLAAFGVI